MKLFPQNTGLRSKLVSPLAKSVYWLATGRDLAADTRTLDRSKKELPNVSLLTSKLAVASLTMNHEKRLKAMDKSSFSRQLSGGGRLEEVFILGSGASLLELSDAEKEFLRGATTIAMNKYLLFWQLVGVWPSSVVLADTHPPAHLVLAGLVAAGLQGNKVPHFLLSTDYADWIFGELPVTFFRRSFDSGWIQWAERLDEPMYFHRGSLTCLLNLITVMQLAKRVTLLGVDLSSPEAFYDGKITQHPDLLDDWDSFGRRNHRHATAVADGGVAPIQDRLPWVFAQMRQRGVEVFCYHQKSLLATANICPLRARLAD